MLIFYINNFNIYDMKYLNSYKIFEAESKEPKVRILTTIDVDDLIGGVGADVDNLYNGIITSIKDFFKKYKDADVDTDEDKKIWQYLVQKPGLNKAKKATNDWILSTLYKDNSRMKSDIIDIDAFLSLDSELGSIKEGDEVLMLTTHSDDKIKNFPVIISFIVEKIDLTGMGWLGLGASNSFCPQIGESWGMIDIQWSTKIVTKDTYNSFADPDKHL